MGTPPPGKHISSAAFIIMTVQLHLASGTINSHRGREGENRQGIKLKRGQFYFGA